MLHPSFRPIHHSIKWKRTDQHDADGSPMEHLIMIHDLNLLLLSLYAARVAIYDRRTVTGVQ